MGGLRGTVWGCRSVRSLGGFGTGRCGMEGLWYWGVGGYGMGCGSSGGPRCYGVRGCSIGARGNDTGVHRGLAGVQGWGWFRGVLVGVLRDTMRMAGGAMGPSAAPPLRPRPPATRAPPPLQPATLPTVHISHAPDGLKASPPPSPPCLPGGRDPVSGELEPRPRGGSPAPAPRVAVR